MLKVAIQYDHKNVAQKFVDLEKRYGKYAVKMLIDPVVDEAEVI